MATPGHRRGGQRTPGRRRGRGPPPTILISIHFDTNCKGIGLRTPGRRRGGQRTPPSMQSEQKSNQVRNKK